MYMRKGGNNNTKILQRGGEILTNANSNAHLGTNEKFMLVTAVIGILLPVLFFSNSNDYATGKVYGYSFSILALVALLTSITARSFRNEQAIGYTGYLSKFMSNGIYVFLLIIVIGLTLYQTIGFYKSINDRHISTEYYTWSYISSILIILQIGTVAWYILNKSKVHDGSDTNNTSSSNLLINITPALIILLTIGNFWMTGISEVILRFFSTDG